VYADEEEEEEEMLECRKGGCNADSDSASVMTEARR
jgi:hypothetical protein